MGKVKYAASRATGGFAVVLVAVALLAAACGGSSGGGSGNGGGGGSTASTPSSASNQVSLSEFKISPSAVTASAGATLSIQNTGTVAHDLVVASSAGGAPLVKTTLIQPGASAQLALPSSVTAGSYTIYCDVPGHKQQGMTGTLTVS
jgi:nitrite reductase (NO-forming)